MFKRLPAAAARCCCPLLCLPLPAAAAPSLCPTHSSTAHPPRPLHPPRSPRSPQGEDGKWNKFGGRLAWDKNAICANNPAFGGGGAWKDTEDYPAAPNIDHAQVGLDWATALIQIGQRI